jgi:hypothetical protein
MDDSSCGSLQTKCDWNDVRAQLNKRETGASERPYGGQGSSLPRGGTWTRQFAVFALHLKH